MSERYEDSGLDEKWRGRRAGYGDTSRWLINQHADGDCWLLHEPIKPNSLGALCFETFEDAVNAFIAFSASDKRRNAGADRG